MQSTGTGTVLTEENCGNEVLSKKKFLNRLHTCIDGLPTRETRVGTLANAAAMFSALSRRSLRSPLAFAVVGSATSITAYAVAPMKCEPQEKLVGLRCNYWAGRGLMEVPRFCLAIAGKEYEDWRLQGDYDATKGMGNALDANLGRLPTIDCVDGTIGQSSAINFYIASECGLMGSSTFEAAKIIEFGEHLKELQMAFRKLVPYGSEPKEEALATFFDSEVATDYEGPADQTKSSGRQLKWYLYRMEKLIGDDGFAVGGKLSLADVQLYNTFADKLGVLSEPFTSAARTDAALDKCPKIKACIASVANHENVKKWLEERTKLINEF